MRQPFQDFALKAPPDETLMTQRGETRTDVDPVLLDQVLLASQRHVVLGAIARCGGGSESPGALVGVLLPSGVIPGVQVGIGRTFLQLVGDNRRHSLSSGIPVQTRSLRRARCRAPVRISYQRLLYVP